jgi:ATP-dependent DNA helicase RecG
LGDEVEDPSEEASVRKTYEHLSKRFGVKNVALLHGKMKEAEKVEILDQFRRGAISVLVATTVVEVGVDVPEASLMVIDHADRLGLSQLHQLRGRIGRGGKSGMCILIQRGGGVEAKERLDFLAANRDGFLVAEKDFEIRGPGDTLGDEQSGAPRYRHARLASDLPLLSVATQEAEGLWAGGWERWSGLVEAEKKARADFAAN